MLQALLPYVLWDRVTKLTASWDTRGKASTACSVFDHSSACRAAAAALFTEKKEKEITQHPA
jgi:predicted DNA-binding WGR domain protein